MAIKVLLVFRCASGGTTSPEATEVHHYLGAATGISDPTLHDAIVQMINLRTQLMGSNTITIGYRASVPGTRRQSVRRISGTALGAGIQRTPLLDQGSADIPNSALQCDLYSDTSIRRAMYMAGLPDAFLTTGGAGGPNFAAPGLQNYQTLWDQWKAKLLDSNWGFYARTATPPGEPKVITSWANQPDSPFELIMGVALADGIWGVGDIFHVRRVLMTNDNFTPPVGKWRVRSVSATATEKLYVLRSSGAFDSTLIDQPGTVESVAYAYVPYKTLDPVNQTSRRRGVGPFRPRGRSRGRRRRQVS